MTPQFEEPQIVTSIAESSHYGGAGVMSDSSISEPYEWWRELGGKELSEWVNQLREHNLVLVEARSRNEQTRISARLKGGNRWPEVTLNNNALRYKSNNTWSNSYSIGLNASLDTDVFGGLRASQRVAELTAAATEADYAALEQQQIATLANNYLAAAALKRRLRLARSAAESYQTTLNVTDGQYRTGSKLTSATDVQIARQNLDSALADIPDLETQLTIQLFEIDGQLARFPGVTAKTFEGDLPSVSDADIPIGMPASLLTRRPDVAVAELQYRAALEDVGVARASQFPGLTLRSNLIFTSNYPGQVFDFVDYTASLFASLVQPVFQGGRLRNEFRLQRAKANELGFAYARTALAALSEVETALAKLAGNSARVRLLRDAVESARLSDELVQNRHRQGLETLLKVLETRRALDTERENLILAEQSLYEARVDLYLSLGGIWFADEPEQQDTTLSMVPRKASNAVTELCLSSLESAIKNRCVHDRNR
ncbi:MAG: transporter [marine bacterium B5-7]|nr:MAG: transporter [marine bacterium B5-7]